MVLSVETEEWRTPVKLYLVCFGTLMRFVTMFSLTDVSGGDPTSIR